MYSFLVPLKMTWFVFSYILHGATLAPWLKTFKAFATNLAKKSQMFLSVFMTRGASFYTEMMRVHMESETLEGLLGRRGNKISKRVNSSSRRRKKSDFHSQDDAGDWLDRFDLPALWCYAMVAWWLEGDSVVVGVVVVVVILASATPSCQAAALCTASIHTSI